MNVLVTGAGNAMGLGFCFVRRYLEQGDHVIATIRRPCPELEALQAEYAGKLDVLTMDIGSTESVQAACAAAAELVPCLDLLINNATAYSPDSNEGFEAMHLDYITDVVNVGAVGPLRVTQALLPLLRKSEGIALIVNMSSECGSIGTCYRTNMFDYAMSKAALNMGTMTLRNTFSGDPKMNIICVQPGWMRTMPQWSNATFDPYEQAEVLQELFEKKRADFDGPVFVEYTGEAYPW